MNELLMSWLRWFYSLPGNIIFWQVTTWIVTLVVLFLGLVHLHFKWRLSIARLKRVNRLRKSQRKLAKSGMNWDKILSGSQGEKARKEALLDLAEKVVLELREERDLLEENNFKTTEEYNKTFNKAVKLRKEFASHLYSLARAGIVVPTDIMDKAYDSPVREIEMRKTKPNKSKVSSKRAEKKEKTPLETGPSGKKEEKK